MGENCLLRLIDNIRDRFISLRDEQFDFLFIQPFYLYFSQRYALLWLRELVVERFVILIVHLIESRLWPNLEGKLEEINAFIINFRTF